MKEIIVQLRTLQKQGVINDKEEVEAPRRRSPRMKSPDKSPRKSTQGKRSTMRLRKSVRNG